MFGFRSKESPSLELYGKLPLAKDYLRVGCGEGSGRELREWMDRAFGSARNPASQPVLREPLRFLGQTHDEPLQGCLWPSSDEGGKRSFPFALFVERRRKPLLSDLEAGLARADRLWLELEALRDSAALSTDGASFLEPLRGRELEVHALEPRAVRCASWEDWLAALWPNEQHEGLNRVLAQIRVLAREDRGGPWRLPLARALPLLDQVLAWNAVLVELGAHSKDRLTTMFFPASAGPPGRSLLEPAFAVLSSSPLSSDAVAGLLPQGEERLGPRDLSGSIEPHEREPSGEREATAPLRHSLRGVLASVRARPS